MKERNNKYLFDMTWFSLNKIKIFLFKERVSSPLTAIAGDDFPLGFCETESPDLPGPMVNFPDPLIDV